MSMRYIVETPKFHDMASNQATAHTEAMKPERAQSCR